MQETSRIWGVALTVLMLVSSNIFMTFAWYWHLRSHKPGGNSWPLIAIILVSWLIAFVEYMIAVPANRIGAAVDKLLNRTALVVFTEDLSRSTVPIRSAPCTVKNAQRAATGRSFFNTLPMIRNLNQLELL